MAPFRSGPFIFELHLRSMPPNLGGLGQGTLVSGPAPAASGGPLFSSRDVPFLGDASWGRSIQTVDSAGRDGGIRSGHRPSCRIRALADTTPFANSRQTASPGDCPVSARSDVPRKTDTIVMRQPDITTTLGGISAYRYVNPRTDGGPGHLSTDGGGG